MKRVFITIAISLFAMVIPVSADAGGNSVKEGSLAETVLNTMKTATRYMMDSVSYNGGFAWRYLPDLSRQWGEMESGRTIVWTQAPSTPQVGQLLLDAYHATGDEYYYESAKKVASALIWGQLPCGGWNYLFDFAGEEALKNWYLTIGASGWRLEEYQHYYGNATFDDSVTTDCAKFLLRMYVEKNDPVFRPPLDKAISFVLESQYPCGGWPQRYPLMYDHPFRGQSDYSSFVTLNDGVLTEACNFLMQCYQALGMSSLKEPVLRAMHLCIVLQQGSPYSGWADQYTVDDLRPAHARSYEPKAISAPTTVTMINKMMQWYSLTGDSRFLSGLPAAIDFLSSLQSAVPAPRFIDPNSGKPLYIHREGSNSYNGHYYIDQDATGTIGHYRSTYSTDIQTLRDKLDSVKAVPTESIVPFFSRPAGSLQRYYIVPSTNVDKKSVKAVVSSLSSQGCWLTPLSRTSNPYKPCPSATPSQTKEYCSTDVGDEYDTSPYRNTDGGMCIETRVYIDNMSTLIAYLRQ